MRVPLWKTREDDDIALPAGGFGIVDHHGQDTTTVYTSVGMTTTYYGEAPVTVIGHLSHDRWANFMRVVHARGR